MKRRSALPIVLLSLLCIALAGCSSGAGGSSNAAAGLSAASLDELVELARAEGELNLSWGEDIFGGSSAAPLIAEGFREYYDLPNFTIRFTPGTGMTQQAATLSQEVIAGQPATSDIFLSYAPPLANLLNLDYETLPVLDWSWAKDVPPAAIGAHGVGVAVQTSFPVITYNSTSVPAPPRSMAELLDPRWNGRVASTPYASNFHYFAAEKGHEQTADYLRRFSDQIAGLIPCNQADRLVSGEYDLFAFDCDQTNAVTSERTGGPLRYVIPADAAMLTYMYASVPVNSVHPAAARLWINYVMTREAQDVIWNLRGVDSTHVPGSHMSEVVTREEGAGVTFSDWDLDAVLDSGRFPSSEQVQQQVAILSGTE